MIKVTKEIIKSEFLKSQKIGKNLANAYVCGVFLRLGEDAKHYKKALKKVYR